MSQIGISYTPSGGSPVYNLVFDNFGGTELPRSYQESATFEKSASGASIVSGSPYRQKYMWAMSSIVPKAFAEEFDNMFRAWDQDRSEGLPAACGVTDTTFGATVNANVVFSTMPTFVRLSPADYLVSFGLMEV